MARFTQLVAYALLALALLAWGGIYVASSSVRASATALSSDVASTQAQEDRLAYQKRLAALAEDTQVERASLETLVSRDLVSIVNQLEATGKPLGLAVVVSDAQASGALQDLPGGGSLRTITFIVESQGTYASLMRLEGLFENLPLASTVDTLELQALQSQQTPWHLTARIRVYTTAPISS
jgi:hypothetical protein